MNLDDFVNKIIPDKKILKITKPLNEIPYIQRKDTIELNIEEAIDYILKKYNCLAHGSTIDIKDTYLRSPNKIYGASIARIAIMRAIYKNNLNLDYPFSIKEPLKLEIDGEPLRDTINDKGYVYLIPNRKGFKNNPPKSWQYETQNIKVPIIAKIEILKHDFKYPVYKVIKIQLQ